MITQFSEAVATQPDGIAVMGHPGDEAFKPLIDDAVAQGIIVTVMNTELPETAGGPRRRGHRLRRCDLHKAGSDLAEGGHHAWRPAGRRQGLRVGPREPGRAR